MRVLPAVAVGALALGATLIPSPALAKTPGGPVKPEYKMDISVDDSGLVNVTSIDPCVGERGRPGKVLILLGDVNRDKLVDDDVVDANTGGGWSGHVQVPEWATEDDLFTVLAGCFEKSADVAEDDPFFEYDHWDIYLQDTETPPADPTATPTTKPAPTTTAPVTTTATVPVTTTATVPVTTTADVPVTATVTATSGTVTTPSAAPSAATVTGTTTTPVTTTTKVPVTSTRNTVVTTTVNGHSGPTSNHQNQGNAQQSPSQTPRHDQSDTSKAQGDGHLVAVSQGSSALASATPAPQAPVAQSVAQNPNFTG